jgi:hypothetical protein
MKKFSASIKMLFQFKAGVVYRQAFLKDPSLRKRRFAI